MGTGCVDHGPFSGLGGPSDRAQQATSVAGHRGNRHLRRHLRRRFLGLRGDVRQEQGGVVPHIPGPAPRHSLPRHLRRRVLPSGPGAVPAVFHGVDPVGGGPCCPARWWPSTARRCAAPTTRGATGKQAIHLVSAWASANTLTLGQVKTEEKSNEITAIPGCWKCWN